jgi:hypothetical protein
VGVFRCVFDKTMSMNSCKEQAFERQMPALVVHIEGNQEEQCDGENEYILEPIREAGTAAVIRTPLASGRSGERMPSDYHSLLTLPRISP